MWLRVKGVTEDCLIQLPCSEQSHLQQIAQDAAQFGFLNISKDKDSTVVEVRKSLFNWKGYKV